jgi:hypothetical protein
MSTLTRERRDWTLLIFIIPIGIILMLIAGQIAIRLASFWSVTANMRSNLDPNLALKRQTGFVQPIGAGILTPYDINLTPDPDEGSVVFPPFIVFESNGTPSVTVSPGPTASSTIQPTIPSLSTKVQTATFVVTKTPTKTITATPIKTIVATATVTKLATAANTSTKTPTLTATVVIATSTLTATRTATVVNATATPTATRTIIVTSTVTSTSTPTPTATATIPFTPTVTATATSTATETASVPTLPPVVSTLDPSLNQMSPPPPVGAPDGTIYPVSGGRYAIVDLGSNSIDVLGVSEKKYDLVYYESEWNNSSVVLLDKVIVGISQSPTANTFFEVFNWGNNVRDANTNVDTDILPTDPSCSNTLAPECANREIPISKLYPYPGTGILIDVDNAPSAPPVGNYRYLVIICPLGYPEAAEIDSIEILPP